MTVSVQPSMHLTQSYAPTKTGKTRAATASNNQQADYVTISQDARKSAQQAKEAAAADGHYPVEYYAIPKWMLALQAYPQRNVVEEMARGKQVLAEMEANRIQDKPRLTRDEMLARYPETPYIRNEHLNEYKYQEPAREYNQIFRSIYLEVLNEEGIHDIQTRYQALLVDKENSERIHQIVAARLREDERAMELMEFLKVGWFSEEGMA